jgi:hypothetical protein
MLLFFQHAQQIQTAAEDQDASGMTSFLSDNDLESDDDLHHHHALAPDHLSSYLKRQACSTNPIVASPATAKQQQRHHPQNLLRQQQQQDQCVNPTQVFSRSSVTRPPLCWNENTCPDLYSTTRDHFQNRHFQ